MKAQTQNMKLEDHMKKMVKKAITIIQNEAAVFSRKPKVHYNLVDADLVTSADVKAQEMYVAYISKHFQDDGIIGEEDNLQVRGKNGRYFTIDPLDGTKAYGRGQSTGVGTMLAHVTDGFVDAAYVGDVNTGEVYGFGPSEEPTRTRFGVTTKLIQNITTPLKERYVVMGHPPNDYPEVVQKMLRQKDGGIFKDMEVTSGSIGITVARLWKSEIGMLILRPSFDTPWDTTPLIGMNKALNLVHLKMDVSTGETAELEPELPQKVLKRDHIEIMLHQSKVSEVLHWIEENR